MNVALTPIRPNLNLVEIGNLAIWFSYTTPIAYAVDGAKHVSVNAWSNTTGRHLSIIGGNKVREPYKVFTEGLDAAVAVL